MEKPVPGRSAAMTVSRALAGTVLSPRPTGPTPLAVCTKLRSHRLARTLGRHERPPGRTGVDPL